MKKYLQNKKVIYNFLVGEYGTLKDPLVKTPGWDYVCFTDNKNLKSNIWEIRPLYYEFNLLKDNKRKAMHHKIEYYKIFEEAYDIIVSVEGTTQINCNLNDFINDINLKDEDIVVPKHWRNCVYGEATEILKQELDYPNVVNNQTKRYKEDMYPSNNGLWSNNLIIRNNKSKNLKKACEIWSEEYKKGSRRDQMSMNYSFWKAKNLGFPLKIKEIHYDIVQNKNEKYFTYYFKEHIASNNRKIKNTKINKTEEPKNAIIDDIMNQIKKTGDLQMEKYEYAFICNVVESIPNCNFLIFGTGRDSKLWLEVNKNNKTVFLEPDKKWADYAKEQNPLIDVRHVKYETKPDDYLNMFFEFKSTNIMKNIPKLPKDVIDTNWDVILIDSPVGYINGRMSSIFISHLLSNSDFNKKNCHVFLHDCERKIETLWGHLFLLQNSKYAEEYSSNKNKFKKLNYYIR